MWRARNTPPPAMERTAERKGRTRRRNERKCDISGHTRSLGLPSSQVVPNRAWRRQALKVEQTPTRIGTGTPDASARPTFFALPWHTGSPSTHTYRAEKGRGEFVTNVTVPTSCPGPEIASSSCFGPESSRRGSAIARLVRYTTPPDARWPWVAFRQATLSLAIGREATMNCQNGNPNHGSYSLGAIMPRTGSPTLAPLPSGSPAELLEGVVVPGQDAGASNLGGPFNVLGAPVSRGWRMVDRGAERD